MNLKDTLHSALQEYARQFGQLIGCDKQEWTPTGRYDLCRFNDALIFNVGDIIWVGNNIEELTARAGSREQLGEEIKAWYQWAFSQPYGRIDHGSQSVVILPAIKLQDWLNGKKDQEKAETEESLLTKQSALKAIMMEYGPDTDMPYALYDIEKKINSINLPAKTEDGDDEG